MEPRGCSRYAVANRIGAYGKEGVDGSSPSEGFGLLPAHRLFVLSGSAGVRSFDVHAESTSVHRSNGGVGCVEELDRVLASVAGEVAVMAIDHRQAGAHVA